MHSLRLWLCHDRVALGIVHSGCGPVLPNGAPRERVRGEGQRDRTARVI